MLLGVGVDRDDVSSILCYLRDILPLSFLSRFGCFHCSWRYGYRCPVRVVVPDPVVSVDSVSCSSSSSPDLSSVSVSDPSLGIDSCGSLYPSLGFCLDRLHWFLSLLPDYATVPSEDRLYRDLMLNLGTLRNLHDYSLLEHYERLHLLESSRVDCDGSKLRYYESKIDKLWSRYHLHFDKLSKLRESELNRTVPRRIDSTVTHLDLCGLQRLLRGDFCGLVDVSSPVVSVPVVSDSGLCSRSVSDSGLSLSSSVLVSTHNTFKEVN